MSESSVTKFLAVYGSLLSSITFGWTLFRDLRDRAKLKLSARVRRFAVGADGSWFAVSPGFEAEGLPEQLYIALTAVNVGRRPIRWESWGGTYKVPTSGKTGFVSIPRALPKMLAERESHMEYADLDSSLLPVSENVKTLFAVDSSGKTWVLSAKQMQTLRKEAVDAVRQATNLPI